ncbi:c-type cytochrome [Cognatishimia activa]|uniref:c-type cytochrome n=1 Tax=Cognatishimia activa TaxID=1715691 RepID=UPI00222F5C86|nr:cytochrome c [Cognatishimia activa]UZD90840.1 cytochrome c [Cognatishimia activa]
MRLLVAVTGGIAAVSTAALWFGVGSSNAAPTSGKKADTVAGKQIYVDYCAACHGAKLEGQENWRSPGPDGKLPAPPHDETGHTWHHADQVLFDYTKLGGAELMATRGIEFASGMPGFSDQLSDEEINNVLAFIKSTWPDRIQKIQAERTQAQGD